MQHFTQPAQARSGTTLLNASAAASNTFAHTSPVLITQACGRTAFSIVPGGPRSIETAR